MTVVCICGWAACQRGRAIDPKEGSGAHAGASRFEDVTAQRGRARGSTGARSLPVPTRTAAAALISDAPDLGPARSPLSLTASDGTGLRLRRLQARAVVQGPLCFTELHLTFQNPQPRTLEGRFAITLPEGASISRFAMRMPAGWQEAEVVERQAARRAYEDFLHRRQDPALLEHEAGNQFSARVFPIEAGAQKELLIAYSEEQANPDAPYRLPLLGLPPLDELSVTAIVGDLITDVVQRDVHPNHDLWIKSPPTAVGRAQALRSDDLMVARLRLQGAEGAAVRGDDAWVVLVDTSASRALGFAGQLRMMAAVVRGISQAQGTTPAVTVAAFDQTVVPMYSGTAGGLDESVVARIAARGALGASDLGGALAWAMAAGQGRRRLLLVTDGVVTAGARDQALRKQAAGLRDAGYHRVDVLLLGGIRDSAAMASLLHGVVADEGALIDGSRGAEAAVARLLRPVHAGLRVTVPGALDVWPKTLDGVQPGDDVMVYAELDDAHRRAQQVTITISGSLTQRQTVQPHESAGPLVERAYVRARIAGLQRDLAQLDPQRESDAGAALRRSVLALSTQYRVLSDQTALLVLESESDYARFGIDRRALADILAVGERGVELISRPPLGPPSVATAAPPPARPASEGALKEGRKESGQSPEGKEIQDVFGSGGLGLVGTGLGGGGSGVAGDRPQVADPPQTSQPADTGAKAQAAGSPDPHADARRVAAMAGVLGLIGQGNGVGEAAPSDGLGSLAGMLGSGRGDGYGTIGIGALGRRNLAGAGVNVGIGDNQTVTGSLDRTLIRRIVQRHKNEIKYCYERRLLHNPTLSGQLSVRFVINKEGNVVQTSLVSSTLADPEVARCTMSAMMRWQFPRPQSGIVLVTYPFAFQPMSAATGEDGGYQTLGPGATWHDGMAAAYSGRFDEAMTELRAGRVDGARTQVESWRQQEPGDVLGLLALGEVCEAAGDRAQAARAYGSIIDLFPARADLRRHAGQRLDRIAQHTPADDTTRAAARLAVDTYARAVEQRPDHPGGHRLLAYAQLRAGDAGAAFTTLETAVPRPYLSDRFPGADQILREDLSIIAAAWGQQAPAQRPDITRRLAALGLSVSDSPSLRFVLAWETDANDVDFHIEDGRRGHAFYGSRALRSGGRLYADVTTGYGPECFNIPGAARAFPYRLGAHYYRRGPMGYGMGKLQIVQHDGHGGIRLQERPFLVMNDLAYIDLGTLPGPL